MLKQLRDMFVSSFNEDGDCCDRCGGAFVSGTSEYKPQASGPDRHVRKLKCASGHVSDRTTDGG